MFRSKKRIKKALISQDAQAGLHLCCSQTSEDRFSRVEAHLKTNTFVYTRDKPYKCDTRVKGFAQAITYL